MPRITRREDEDPVPEAAQVMGELLNGDREAIEQWEGIAGEKTNSQKRSRCEVQGARFKGDIPNLPLSSTLNVEP